MFSQSYKLAVELNPDQSQAWMNMGGIQHIKVMECVVLNFSVPCAVLLCMYNMSVFSLAVQADSPVLSTI